MTKADIIEALHQKIRYSKKEAADLVELIFDTIKDTLARGEKIKISGFGNFVSATKKSGSVATHKPARPLRFPLAAC